MIEGATTISRLDFETAYDLYCRETLKIAAGITPRAPWNRDILDTVFSVLKVELTCGLFDTASKIDTDPVTWSEKGIDVIMGSMDEYVELIRKQHKGDLEYQAKKFAYIEQVCVQVFALTSSQLFGTEIQMVIT